MRPEPYGFVIGVGKGQRLGRQMRRLRQLHLYGVHAVRRPSVVARGPAALEAAVDDMGITRCRGTDFPRFILYPRSATHAVIGADVEVGQPALEQERAVRADRVAVV